MKNKYVIAGGAGFLGSHIVDYLLDRGYKVVVLDNFSTGTLENLRKNINSPNLKIYNVDITQEVPDIKNVDGVFHLACNGNPYDYENYEINTLNVNSYGVVNLINLAERNNAWFIYFSSSEVYGDHIPLPKSGLVESNYSIHFLLHKRSHYPVGKMFGEEITSRLCRKKDIDYLIIRPFNIYGSRMDRKSSYGRVIINFFNWALNRKPCIVNGDGTQTRSFLYIDDFISFIDRIMRVGVGKLKWNVMNIGSTEEISIGELAEIINNICENDAGIKYAPRYPYEPMYRRPNIDRAKSLGWKPKIPLRDGLKKLKYQLMEEL